MHFLTVKCIMADFNPVEDRMTITTKSGKSYFVSNQSSFNFVNIKEIGEEYMLRLISKDRSNSLILSCYAIESIEIEGLE